MRRPLRQTKRGDLAISTNAIVILIIAVIMLGLIIGFVTKSFQKVTTNINNQIEQLPPPARPTASDPITVSPEIVDVTPGEQFGLKLMIYNTLVEDAYKVRPKILCNDQDASLEPQATLDRSGDDSIVDYGTPGDEATSTVKVNAQDITAKTASKVYTYYAVAKKNIPGGKQLCRLVVHLRDTNGQPLYFDPGVNTREAILSTDLTLNVAG